MARRDRSSISCSTASPVAAETGLPAKVLKYMLWLPNSSSNASVVTTAAERMAIAHGLAQGGQVRDDAVQLESPHGVPCAPEPGLDLVGDHQAAGGMHAVGQPGHVAARDPVQPLGGEQRVKEHRRQSDARVPQ